MENKKWYVGQEVWDKTESFNEGIVDEIRRESIIVCFPDTPKHNYVEYNFEGCKVNIKNMFSILKTLSTKPYEIIMEGFSQEVEEELPKKGQIVWVKSSLGKWYITHFQFKDVHLGCAVSPFNSPKEGISYCEEITTKNPYEDSDVSKMENTDREPQIGDIVYAWDVGNANMLHCGELLRIDLDENYPYTFKNGDCFNFCSLKNPLIK